MKSKSSLVRLERLIRFCGMGLCSLLLLTTLAGAQATSRLMGTITAINGSTLSIKPDAGDPRTISVAASTVIKRIEAGQKDLSTAVVLNFSGLAVGDRVLVKLAPSAAAGDSQALQIVAIKQEDLAAKQQKDREDWQKRGIGGLVKSVDVAAAKIVVTTGAGATAKNVTIALSKTTLLKRYAPTSVDYAEAKPGPVDAIHPGDQLRARGNKSADGLQVDADEVVSGTFRNLSGTIAQIDAAAGTITIKDLTTKKQFTIHLTAQAQMKRIPEMMAKGIAARLKGGAQAAGASRAPQGGGDSAATSDPAGFLSHAPSIQLTDLKKGDAVMLVTTDGATDVTAITLLAGVEPLLEAPAASNLLANWSMGGGEGGQ